MRLGAALVGILGIGAIAGCESLWGSLSEPAAENCLQSNDACLQGQICNPITALCEEAIGLSQITPARARTDMTTPVTITGANFVPGMMVKWNGTELPTTVDSATELRVTAPASADGAFLVKVEVSNPRGARVSRSDLFSYYASAVSFQVVTPTGASPINSLFTMRALPATATGRALMVFTDGPGRLRGMAFSSDGATSADAWTLTSPSPSAIKFGDFDGDGTPDLLAVTTNTFIWHPGNPDATFQQPRQLYSVTNPGLAMAFGDVDNDGQGDLVGIDGDPNNNLVIMSAGKSQPTTYPGGSLKLYDIVVADLDGKPGNEIAVTYQDLATHLTVIRGSTLMAYPDVPIAPCMSGMLKVGGFDGALQSLVLYCPDRVQLMPVAGGGTFGAGFSWPVDATMQRLVNGTPLLADFDGDGDLDIVAVRGPLKGDGLGEIWLLRNSDGHGTLAAEKLAGMFTLTETDTADVTDVNGDGKPDVIIADRHANATTPVMLLLNTSR